MALSSYDDLFHAVQSLQHPVASVSASSTGSATSNGMIDSKEESDHKTSEPGTAPRSPQLASLIAALAQEPAARSVELVPRPHSQSLFSLSHMLTKTTDELTVTVASELRSVANHEFERARKLKYLLKNPDAPGRVVNTRFLTQEGQCSREISVLVDETRAARDRGTDSSVGWCAVQLSLPDLPANGSVSISFELSCRFVRLGWALPSLNLEKDAKFSHYAAAGCFICSAGSAGPSNEVAFGLGNVDASQYSAFQSSADRPASVTMVYTRLPNSNSTIHVSVNGGESTLVFSRVPDNLIPVVSFGTQRGFVTITASSFTDLPVAVLARMPEARQTLQRLLELSLFPVASVRQEYAKSISHFAYQSYLCVCVCVCVCVLHPLNGTGKIGRW
jgi:hypothetical protein